MTPHFTLAEFTASDTAARLGIDNHLPDELAAAAHRTLEMMERIRFHIDAPISITSGYRCEALNKAVGSKPESDHMMALAVDFKAPKAGTPFAIAASLAPVIKIIGIGQLILEFGTWVHVSTRIPDKLINRVITVDKTGTRAGIWTP
jgi:zinc D-Ala-D-Ala carboxypeptidase